MAVYQKLKVYGRSLMYYVNLCVFFSVIYFYIEFSVYQVSY